MTEQELAEIEARAQAATAGPWTVGVSWDSVWQWPVMRLKVMCGGTRDALEEEASRNSYFVQASRADVPALVAEVRRLRAELERGSDAPVSQMGAVGG